ncbi:MAG: fibrobacter succinogenes major paralogous domain-containing protein [Candidatus Falkowbacteria bacterium]
MNKKIKTGFTLIELVVVVAIIGIIMTVSFISFNNARQKSRDSKRLSDITQIQNSLSLYFRDEGKYPESLNFGQALVGSRSSTTYIQIIPSAPTPADGTCDDNQNTITYTPNSNRSSYSLSFCLGNTAGSLNAGPKCSTPVGIIDGVCVVESQPAPTVTLGVSPSSIAEAAGTATLTATLSSTTTSDVTVNLSYSGTATVTSDYTRPSSITITAGSLTGTAILTAVQDFIYEGNETVITDISSVTNATESGTQQATVAIADDETVPTVTLAAATSSVAEAAGTVTLFSHLSTTASSDVTVNLSYSGTAAITSDYNGPSSITIPAGSLGVATVTAIQDTTYEGNETIIIDISSVVGANEFGTQQVTITIVDDDSAPFVCGTSQLTIASTAGHTCNEAAPYYDKCTYDTVSIGTQCWMKQNMNVGTIVTGVTEQTNNSPTPILEKYCYSNSYVNCQNQGALYQWNEAMQYVTTEPNQGICPTGWHIPTDLEQYTLENYLKDTGNSCNAARTSTFSCDSAGGKLKIGGSSGFNAPMAGYRGDDTAFYSRTTLSSLWSSTITTTYAWTRGLDSSITTIDRRKILQARGLSVRCLKD